MDLELRHVLQPDLLVAVEDLEGLGDSGGASVDDAGRPHQVGGLVARQGHLHLGRQLGGGLDMAADLVEPGRVFSILRI